MNVLVLGGTQFIGPFVTKQLVSEGHAVTVFHRGVTEPELPPEVGHIHGDRSALPRFASQLRSLDADVVIDMRSMVEAHALSVVEVLAGYVERAVVISSMDVYRGYDVLRGTDQKIQPGSFSEEHDLRTHLFPYREEEPHKPGDPQQWLDDYDKILVERAFLEEPRLKTTVLRLPAVYGPGDGQHRLRDSARRIADGRRAMVVDSEFAGWRFTHGYVENVAAAIVLTATRQPSATVYNVGEADTPSRETWLRRIFAVAGWDGEVVVVPWAKLPDSLRVQGMNLRQDMAADCTKIREDLGFVEPITWDEGIRRTIEWELSSLSQDLDRSDDDYADEDEVLARLSSNPSALR